MASLRILIVEDEPGISEPLSSHLAREGFEPTIAPTIGAAREAFAATDPDVVLLDVMLPDGDGRDLCRELRASSDVPIVLLTARGEDVDKIVGLELGADDYVVKPFSAGELVARIRAILRRGRSRDAHAALEVGDVRLDPDARTVTRAGTEIALAAKEFDLLALLMAQRGPGRSAGGHHGRGVGRALVRFDEDARRPHLVAAQEARGRPRRPPVHHHDPRGGLPVRGAPRRTVDGRARIGGRRRRSAPGSWSAFAYISVVIIVALTIPLAVTLDRRARTELERENLVRADAVAQDIGAANLGPDRRGDLRALIRRAGLQADGRVIVVDANGRLIADSQGPATGQPYATPQRPEIVAALKDMPTSVVRYSSDLGVDIMATAVPIVGATRNDTTTVVGAVRITRSMDQVNANVRRITLGVFAIGAAGLLAGLIMAFALSGSLARPLRRLADAAQRFGSGDLDGPRRRHPRTAGGRAARLVVRSDGRARRGHRAGAAGLSANASHQLRTPLRG